MYDRKAKRYGKIISDSLPRKFIEGETGRTITLYLNKGEIVTDMPYKREPKISRDLPQPVFSAGVEEIPENILFCHINAEEGVQQTYAVAYNGGRISNKEAVEKGVIDSRLDQTILKALKYAQKLRQ